MKFHVIFKLSPVSRLNFTFSSLKVCAFYAILKQKIKVPKIGTFHLFCSCAFKYVYYRLE